MSDHAIERAEVVAGAGEALATLYGGGSVRRMLAQIEENVRDVIDVARDRGFVARYGDGSREFFGLPAWQTLAAVYGLVSVIEWSRETQDGYEARAIVQTIDGRIVGAAEAMCTRSERNKRSASAHDLRAMAQTRAQRNAYRSVLGSALVLAGFDFADPDAPATADQMKALWTLADRLGWSRDEAHERAGVASLSSLTREAAGELIDEWAGMAGAVDGDVREGMSRPERQPETESGKGSASAASESAAGEVGGDPGGAVVEPTSPVVATSEGESMFGDPWRDFEAAIGAVGSAGFAAARKAAIRLRYGWPAREDWPAERLEELAHVAREASK